MIDASVLLYLSFDSLLSQSRSMVQAVPAIHLAFYRLTVLIKDISDIYRYSDIHQILARKRLHGILSLSLYNDRAGLTGVRLFHCGRSTFRNTFQDYTSAHSAPELVFHLPSDISLQQLMIKIIRNMTEIIPSTVNDPVSKCSPTLMGHPVASIPLPAGLTADHSGISDA